MKYLDSLHNSFVDSMFIHQIRRFNLTYESIQLILSVKAVWFLITYGMLTFFYSLVYIYIKKNYFSFSVYIIYKNRNDYLFVLLAVFVASVSQTFIRNVNVGSILFYLKLWGNNLSSFDY